MLSFQDQISFMMLVLRLSHYPMKMSQSTTCCLRMQYYSCNRTDLFRAAMVGPAGTPYHDGLFFFDIKLPPSYPATPPQVRAAVTSISESLRAASPMSWDTHPSTTQYSLCRRTWHVSSAAS
jgi:Ubiquitin-conjugating enzyme